MSDADLRELERRFRETGGVEEEVAWLRERVRARDLGQESLDLAARLGNEASRLACGVVAPHDERGVTIALLEDSVVLGSRVLNRAAAACLRAVTNAWSVSSGSDSSKPWRAQPESLTRMVERLEDALASGREDLAVSALAAVYRSHFQGLKHMIHGDSPQAALLLLALVDLCKPGETVWDEVALGQALRRELVPWALGYSDPVRERVEARQREAARE